jgi:hypothetical protein
VQRDQATIDRSLHRRAIFTNATASVQKFAVDCANVDPAGVIGLHGIGDQVGEGAVFGEFHLANPHLAIGKSAGHRRPAGRKLGSARSFPP